MSLELEPKFRAPAPPSKHFLPQLHHLKVFGPSSSYPKLLGLRLHSPGFMFKLLDYILDGFQLLFV